MKHLLYCLILVSACLMHGQEPREHQESRSRSGSESELPQENTDSSVRPLNNNRLNVDVINEGIRRPSALRRRPIRGNNCSTNNHSDHS